MKNIFSFALLALLWSSCAPSKIVVALDEGQRQAGLTLGQPRINETSLPLLGAYGAYGVTDTRTTYGSVQLTSMMLGAVQLEGGMLTELRPAQGWMPGISWNAAGHLLVSARNLDTRFYPEAAGHLFWQRGPHIAHLSAATWIDPTFMISEYGKGQVLAPHFGAGYRLRYKWFEAQVEYKILNPTRELIVPMSYVPGTYGVGGKGLYTGIAINF